jgi:hypothetical protein
MIYIFFSKLELENPIVSRRFFGVGVPISDCKHSIARFVRRGVANDAAD